MKRRPTALVVALAGRFRHSGSLEDLASRIGAISQTAGLPYWSTTEQSWRVLISEAFALEAPDGDRKRADFTADEILAGRRLYFAQNDTRSTGLNIYALASTNAGQGHLSVEIENISPIRFALLNLFDAGSLRSRHIIEQQGANIWGYYGISTVTGGQAANHEKSLINRNAAFYRYLIGQVADQGVPLAP